MARNKLKLDQLAKLRQFRKGDDIGEFLSTQFRQIVRALEQGYVNVEETDLTSINASIAELSTANYALSESSGSFSTTSASFVDVTNLSVTITTTGRPVIITLGDMNYIGVVNSANNASGNVAIYSGATQLRSMTYEVSATGATAVSNYTPTPFKFIDVPAAGTYTYSIKAKANSGTIRLYACKLLAYEL